MGRCCAVLLCLFVAAVAVKVDDGGISDEEIDTMTPEQLKDALKTVKKQIDQLSGTSTVASSKFPSLHPNNNTSAATGAASATHSANRTNVPPLVDVRPSLCPANCSGRGQCQQAEGTNHTRCVCASGYSGLACQISSPAITPPHVPCPNNCHGHGICKPSADGEMGCVCDPGFEGNGCGRVSALGSCAELSYCSGHGMCVVTGKQSSECECDEGFTGPRCELVDHSCECRHGTCVSDGGCTCDDLYTGPLCSAFDASAVPPELKMCSGQGVLTVSPPDTLTCSCQQGFGGAACDLLEESSCAPSQCSGLGRCQELQGQCVCNGGQNTLTNCTTSLCSDGCSGHGVCQPHPTAHCDCDFGWQGGDCGTRNTEVWANCPRYCSGHGNCVLSEQGTVCACESGWGGEAKDCSQEVPSTPCCGATDENAHTECSNNGSCQDGCVCACFDGYTGDTCGEQEKGAPSEPVVVTDEDMD